MSERQNALSQKILVIISTLMMCTISFSLSAPTLLTNEATVEAGPPTAGTTNLTVLNTTYLNGTQSYDDLYIGCGSTLCGSIVATGDLILSVNSSQVQGGRADATAKIGSAPFGVMTLGIGRRRRRTGGAADATQALPPRAVPFGCDDVD